MGKAWLVAYEQGPVKFRKRDCCAKEIPCLTLFIKTKQSEVTVIILNH